MADSYPSVLLDLLEYKLTPERVGVPPTVCADSILIKLFLGLEASKPIFEVCKQQFVICYSQGRSELPCEFDADLW